SWADGIPAGDASMGPLAGWLPPIPDDAQPVLLDGIPERGDFLTRLLAHLIDVAPMVAIVVIFLILQFVCGLIPGVRIIAGCLLSALQTIICLAYWFVCVPWCWSKYGATPGKKMMKLRVVPEDDPAGRIPLGTAYLRLLGHMVNGCLLGLPYLMILGNERKGLQDMFSKSICIKVDR
ncbi:MAG TPA: RDD family protein, partial [Holophaga sp.]|nr:RDD family protein [Holophaga sp.]